jgi:hypothetical protein
VLQPAAAWKMHRSKACYLTCLYFESTGNVLLQNYFGNMFMFSKNIAALLVTLA